MYDKLISNDIQPNPIWITFGDYICVLDTFGAWRNHPLHGSILDWERL